MEKVKQIWQKMEGSNNSKLRGFINDLKAKVDHTKPSKNKEKNTLHQITANPSNN